MKFTEEHLWLRIEDGEEEVSVGLSAFAAAELGEAKFIELPEEGDTVSADEQVAVIEGSEDALDVLAPLDGEIVEVNTRLIDAPEVISEDPQGEAWLFKMVLDDPSEMDALMSEGAYQKFIR
ncbi:glycine cleavage system protein GcvH [Sulfitobacter albidus]|uniref:Glycine cleavage system protein GcvH n=1 Tax=Sulfitobacter albidus TaxID=2829501 RepID=A0A975JDS9_9RHOB|nr:glycine cleavage system protein GcvH [Sulfitobacter albidus]QUJ76629.1 glycine cleavage system protein GcvH [Sulfitobacter albidus]